MIALEYRFETNFQFVRRNTPKISLRLWSMKSLGKLNSPKKKKPKRILYLQHLTIKF